MQWVRDGGNSRLYGLSSPSAWRASQWEVYSHAQGVDSSLYGLGPKLHKKEIYRVQKEQKLNLTPFHHVITFRPLKCLAGKLNSSATPELIAGGGGAHHTTTFTFFNHLNTVVSNSTTISSNRHSTDKSKLRKSSQGRRYYRGDRRRLRYRAFILSFFLSSCFSSYSSTASFYSSVPSYCATHYCVALLRCEFFFYFCCCALHALLNLCWKLLFLLLILLRVTVVCSSELLFWICCGIVWMVQKSR